MVLETFTKYEVVHDKSRSICFGNCGNVPKMGFFLNAKKNLVINFHWICSIMKMYIVCCVPAQILYWEKSCSLDIKPECCHPIRLQDFEIDYFSRAKQSSLMFCFVIQIHKNWRGQSGLWTLKLTVSEEWTDGITDFLRVDADS